MRLPLIGGAYQSRSLIANAQRCINLFPEINPKDALVPVTTYQRPGLNPLVAPPAAAAGRGIYRASNGQGYCVIGNTLYQITAPGGAWSLTALGQISNLASPVSMSDNGVNLVCVDGQPNGGWAVNLTSGNFEPIVDTTGVFQGAIKVDFIDTFLVFGPSPPTDSNNWISTMSGIIEFNPLYTGGKTDYPDPLSTLIVNRHEIVLLGQLKSEIWYDAGNAQFPFAELPGAFIEHGCLAPYSVCSTDISVIWLGQDLQGQGVVFRFRGYMTTRISNHALEYQLRKLVDAGISLSDATAYTYQQDGHYFYVLSLPGGDQTWVFDDSMVDPMEGWHQRGWTDANGVLHRERPIGAAFMFGTNVALDWQNGTLYKLDLNYFVDTVEGVDYPVQYIRSFPKIGIGISEQKQIIQADGHLIKFNKFMLDIETGTIAKGAPGGPPPQITCRYSDDRGRTFSGSELLSLGAEGDFLEWPTLRELGMARDRVFEVSWIGSGQVALNGAWVDGQVMNV